VPRRALVCLIGTVTVVLASLTWPPLEQTVLVLARIAWLYLLTGAQG
jgi:hypothetical protein